MDFGFKIAPRARKDLQDIWCFISRDNPVAADSFRQELVVTAKSLCQMPRRHGEVKNRPGVHKLPHGDYIIFYRVDEAAHLVEILRFWHTAQSPHRFRLRETSPRYSTVTAAA